MVTYQYGLPAADAERVVADINTGHRSVGTHPGELGNITWLVVSEHTANYLLHKAQVGVWCTLDGRLHVEDRTYEPHVHRIT